MKIVKMILVLLICFILMTGMSLANDPSLYYSLHDPSQSYYYCSRDSGLGGVQQFPCYPPYPYYNQVYYTAVKDRLNPDDIKVVCHLNPADATTCSSMTQSTFDFGGSVTPSSITSYFRLFIPPGAVNVTVQYYVPRDSQMVVLSRFGQPPLGSTETYPATSIKAAPFTISDYRTAEHPVMNTDGLITPISNDTPSNDFLQSLITTAGNTGGGWLYMKLLYYSGGNIQLIKFTLTVKLDIFREWYNKVNSIPGYWDSMGNPPYISSENLLCTNPPTAYITPNPSVTSGIQSGTSVNFSANSASGWTWSMTDTTSGTNVDLSAIPTTNQNFNYTFNTAGKNYNVSLVVKDANGCYSSPATVSVNVAQQSGTQYTVNFAAGTGGSISGNTSQTVSSGGTTTMVTATPNTGYKFINWTGSNGSVLTSNPLTVSNVTASATYTANFQQITQYTVNFLAGINGTINGGSSTSQTVTEGNSTTGVTATPNSSYQFVNWTGTNGFTSTANPLTVSNVSSNMAVVANFQSTPAFTVTFLAGTGGFVIGDSAQRVNQNNNTAAVTAKAESGYQFVNWAGTGGFAASTNNPLIVQNVTYDMTITANFVQTPTSSQKLDVFVDVPQDRIGRFADPYIISNDKAKNYSSVVIEPTLQFHNLPSGKYDLYAAILVDGVLYLATKDILSQIVFVKWMGEDDMRSYDSKDFSGDQAYLFNVFENINIEPLPSPQALAGIGAHFFVAIAPSGSSYLNDFINIFRGSEIYFSPDIR